MKHNKFFLLLSLLLSFSLFLCGCAQQTLRGKRSVSWYDLFDTYCTFTMYDADETVFQSVSSGLYETLLAFHRETDIYHAYTDEAGEALPNLYALNAQAGKEEGLSVGKELYDFLVYARIAYEISKGRVNVMLGPVTTLWKQARDTKVLPAQDALQAANEHTSICLLVLEESSLTARITDPEGSIDVGALAKGYAGRIAMDYLESQGVTDYLLNLGGNIVTGGKPSGTGRDTFTIGIQDPDGAEGSYRQTVSLTSRACATSGDYQRYVEIDGVRYHHIIDPDTLRPSTYHRSVTVFCDDPAMTDLLSTALFCMDEEEGTALASRYEAQVLYLDE